MCNCVYSNNLSLSWLISGKRRGLVKKQNGLTGFGFHSIQHVLIGKALFDLLVPIIHVKYTPYDMRSHRPTHIHLIKFHITLRVFLINYL